MILELICKFGIYMKLSCSCQEIRAAIFISFLSMREEYSWDCVRMLWQAENLHYDLVSETDVQANSMMFPQTNSIYTLLSSHLYHQILLSKTILHQHCTFFSRSYFKQQIALSMVLNFNLSCLYYETLDIRLKVCQALDRIVIVVVCLLLKG